MPQSSVTITRDVAPSDYLSGEAMPARPREADPRSTPRPVRAAAPVATPRPASARRARPASDRRPAPSDGRVADDGGRGPGGGGRVAGDRGPARPDGGSTDADRDRALRAGARAERGLTAADRDRADRVRERAAARERAGRARSGAASARPAVDRGSVAYDHAPAIAGPGRAAGVPGRRTITIQGRGSDRSWAPTAERRRPARRPHERAGFRPDRAAMWAVMLGLVLVLVAATSSHAAVRTRHGRAATGHAAAVALTAHRAGVVGGTPRALKLNG